MATNTASPMGLIASRNRFGGSPTYQPAYGLIKKGYASNINIGDLVITGTSASQGYVILSTGLESAQLGVFRSIAGSVGTSQMPGATGGGYYDNSIQQYVYGLNGAYQSTANPSGDIACMVDNDPGLVFRVQMINGAWNQNLMGQNINFTAATNGVGNGAGISTLSVDFNLVGTSNTLPFRIVGLSGVTGGPQDPANTNPWIEVALNTPEMLASTGI